MCVASMFSNIGHPRHLILKTLIGKKKLYKYIKVKEKNDLGVLTVLFRQRVTVVTVKYITFDIAILK